MKKTRYNGLGFPIDLKGVKTREFRGEILPDASFIKENCFATHFKEFLGVTHPPKNLEKKIK